MNSQNFGTFNGQKVTFLKGRVYPSTEVQNIRSKRLNERPRITPSEMRGMCQKFSMLPPNRVPRLRHEHNLDPREELGVIHRVWYDENDKWMWMEAGVYEKNKEMVGKLLRNGIFRNGISLSYFSNGQYKDFIEISLTNNPDFEGASVEYFHNTNIQQPDIIWKLSSSDIFPPHYFNFMAHQQPQSPPASFEASDLDQYYQRLPNGVMVVRDASKVQAIQQLAVSRGIDPSLVVYQDMSGLESMTEEQKTAILAATLAENQRYAQETQRQHAERQQQVMQTTLQEIRPVVDFATGCLPDADRDSIGQALAFGMATNPQMRAMGDLMEAQMHEFNRLRAENEMLKKQSSFQYNTQFPSSGTPSMQSSLNNGMFTPTPGFQQPSIHAHSAGYSQPSQFPYYPPGTSQAPASFAPIITTGMSMSDMWKQMTQAQHNAQQTHQQQQSQVPEIHQHNANPSAKRQEHPTTDRPAILDRYSHNGFELFPRQAGDAANLQSDSKEVAIFAHSASSPAGDTKRRRGLYGSPILSAPPGGFLQKLKRNCSNSEFMTANLGAILTGERYIGKVPREFLTDNLFTANPELFAVVASGQVNGQLIDNGNAGLLGYAQGSQDRIVQRIRERGLENKYFVPQDDYEARSNAFFKNNI